MNVTPMLVISLTFWYFYECDVSVIYIMCGSAFLKIWWDNKDVYIYMNEKIQIFRYQYHGNVCSICIHIMYIYIYIIYINSCYVWHHLSFPHVENGPWRSIGASCWTLSLAKQRSKNGGWKKSPKKMVLYWRKCWWNSCWRSKNHRNAAYMSRNAAPMREHCGLMLRKDGWTMVDMYKILPE